MPPKTRGGPPPEPSLELFGEGVRRGIERIGQSFTAPDDDWVNGLLHIETKRHEHEVYVLDGTLLQPGRKDALFQYLAALLQERKAVRYGLLLNAWMLKTERREGESREQASERAMAQSAEWSGHFDEHPERVELLTLELVDSERAEHWHALIERHEEGPPTLAPWECFPGEVEGRVTWLRRSLQEEA